MEKKRIVVGMSGGVDSALTAALLQQQGHEVIGVTIKTCDYKNKSERNSIDFIERAKMTAQHLHIPHYVINREEIFKEKVIDPFISAYQKGHTPLPCAHCNRDVKLASLHEVMSSFQAQGMATGHYVRLIPSNHGVQIHQGTHPRRDQSFFLFDVPYAYFQKMHFPLGMYSKEQTRENAQHLGLSVAQTPSSQDLCFIDKSSHADLFPHCPGDIYHENGDLLGKHKGLPHYTIGQRQGLSIGGQAGPLYVTALDAHLNRVIVGPKDSLKKRFVKIHSINWLLDEAKEKPPSSLSVKIRSTSAPIAANITWDQNKEAIVAFHEPEYGVAEGQACAFYQDTRLLGGGWIAS